MSIACRYCRAEAGRGAVLLFAVMHAAMAVGVVPADGLLATPAAPYRAPYIPGSDAEVMQQVPAAANPAVRQIAELRQLLRADPKNMHRATDLARAYVDFGRQLGDAHYAGYAEAVIAPWMKAAQPSAEVLVVQATILQYRHDFSGARRLLKSAVMRDPRNAQAWLTLATLDMVQGEYAAARDDCLQVAKHGGLTLSLACTGNLRSYLGQAQQSIALLGQIESDAASVPASFKSWVEGLLAESYERLGNWAQAEAHYRKALVYSPDDNFLLVAYADFLLDRGRPQEVLSLLKDYAQSDTAFLRLALAQGALGGADLPRYTWIMTARFEALTQRGSDYYGREQVRFALQLQHDPERALSLAQRNWEVQRAPWDARVFLEAALAAKKPQSAAPVLVFLQQTKLQDPVIEPLARQIQAQLVTGASPAP